MKKIPMATQNKQDKTAKQLKKLSKLKQKFSTYEATQHQLYARAIAMEQALKKHQSDLNRVQETVRELGDNRQLLSGQQQTLNQRLDKLLSDINNQYSQQESKYKGLLQQNHKYELQQQQFAAALTKIENRFEDDTGLTVVQGELNKLREASQHQQNSVAQRIDSAESSMAILEKRIDQMSGQQASLLGKMDELQQQIGDQEIAAMQLANENAPTIQSLTTELKALAAHLEDIRQAEQSARNNLETNQVSQDKKLDFHNSTLSALENEQETQRNQLAAMHALTERQLDEISALRTITDRARNTAGESSNKIRWLAIGGGAVAAALLLLILIFHLSPLESASNSAALDSHTPVVAQREEVTRITEKLSNIDQNLGGIQQELAAVRGNLETEGTRETLQLIDRRLETLASGVGAVSTQPDIEKLREVLASSKQEWQALIEELGGIKKELAGLNLTQSLNEINLQLKQVNERTGSIPATVDGDNIQQELRSINQQLKVLTQHIAAANLTSAAAALGELPKLVNRVEQLRQEIQTVDASVKEELGNVRQEQGELSSTVQSVSARVSQLETPESSVEAVEDQWAAAAGNRFTIQLMGVSNETLLHPFVQRTTPAHPLGIRESSFRGKPWYVLLQGIYPNLKAAQEALAELPPEMQENKPWIRLIPQGAYPFIP